MVLCHRFDKNLLLMRTGRYGTLQMMSANPKAGLDRKLTEVVMLASKMEIEDIELQVGFRLLLYHFFHVACGLMRLAVLCRAIPGTIIRWLFALSYTLLRKCGKRAGGRYCILACPVPF